MLGSSELDPRKCWAREGVLQRPFRYALRSAPGLPCNRPARRCHPAATRHSGSPTLLGGGRGAPGGRRANPWAPAVARFGGRPRMDRRSPEALTSVEKARERAWRLLADAKATANPRLRKQLLAEALKLAQLLARLEHRKKAGTVTL